MTATLLSVICACAAQDTDREPPTGECSGSLTVTVPLTRIPSKVRVEWRVRAQPIKTVDECSGPPLGLHLERATTSLLVRDEAFFYTPPPAFDLKILDRGDCSGSVPDVTLVDVQAYSVPGVHASCDMVNVSLPVP